MTPELAARLRTMRPHEVREWVLNPEITPGDVDDACAEMKWSPGYAHGALRELAMWWRFMAYVEATRG